MVRYMGQVARLAAWPCCRPGSWTAIRTLPEEQLHRRAGPGEAAEAAASCPATSARTRSSSAAPRWMCAASSPRPEEVRAVRRRTAARQAREADRPAAGAAGVRRPLDPEVERHAAQQPAADPRGRWSPTATGSASRSQKNRPYRPVRAGPADRAAGKTRRCQSIRLDNLPQAQQGCKPGGTRDWLEQTQQPARSTRPPTTTS